ncbi:fucolectin-6-like [Mytilus californianus]|uniref:fucolectin-6-like n=1 Tax=Mytilus californianus TaxID=6549 RepID=UPI002246F48B|nr:fucolectin-6-like [Mytilus californianus]
MFLRKSSSSHISTTFLLFTMGEVIGKEMYSRLELRLDSNTEALEDNNIKLNKNTKSINRNAKILEDILKFLKDSNLSSIKQEKTLLEVAQGKRTYQSSTHDSMYASKFAVDGRLNTIQHTKKQHFPYWVVDIGTIYNIERIEIYNEPDCCGERLRDLDILIGPYHNAMKLCAHYAGPSHTGDHLVFKCGGILPGRYVKLMMRRTEYLHVAEVKVFARIE